MGRSARLPLDGDRGVALVAVLVLTMLTGLLVLWASRTARFNEIVTGIDSDYQRAFEAAQAMVRDAEFDIQGTDAEGQPCAALPDAACRGANVASNPPSAHFPLAREPELNALLIEALDAQTPSCIAGICTPVAVAPEFWTDERALTAMQAVAARYGRYTGASAGTNGNPLLQHAPPKAWYWVELLPYDVGAATRSRNGYAYRADAELPYIYRITAVAQGVRPGTQAVVQTIFVRRLGDG